MRRMLLVLIVLTLSTGFPATLQAREFNFQSTAQLLKDAGSGRIIYENNSRERLYPASVTKIMTMLLAMEALESGKVTLTDMVPVSERAAGMGGSQLFLSPGDRVSFEDLMIGIGVGSANDGSVAIAEYLAGSVEAFVSQMNQKAAALGMTGTNFINPNGLHHELHYTTAYDIALMSRQLLQHPKIHQWLTLWMDENFLKGRIKKSEGVFLSNSNNLIRFYDGADGLKTGFTSEAGNCVSGTARRGDTRLIVVIMNAPGRTVLFADAKKLLDWGFANFAGVPIAKKGEVVGTVPVEKGNQERVNLVAARDFALLQPKGQKGKELEQRLEIPQRLAAPFTAGDEVGSLVVKSADGEELGRVSLLTESDVRRATISDFFRRLLYRWLRFGR